VNVVPHEHASFVNGAMKLKDNVDSALSDDAPTTNSSCA
jgi:hypothetical protein